MNSEIVIGKWIIQKTSCVIKLPGGGVDESSCQDWCAEKVEPMIRKLKSGEYRLYSRKRNPRTGKRRNLGTFPNLAAARKHERAVQFFKRLG